MKRTLLYLASAASVATSGYVCNILDKAYEPRVVFKDLNINQREGSNKLGFGISSGTHVPKVYADVHRIDNAFNDMKQMIDMYCPNNLDIYEYTDHIVAFNNAKRIPYWVFEHLTNDRLLLPKNACQSSDLSVCEKVPKKFVPEYYDYKHTQQGMLGQPVAHRYSPNAVADLLLKSNTLPERRSRRDGGQLAKIGKQVINSMLPKYQEIYSVTGPLFLPLFQRKDKNDKPVRVMRYAVIRNGIVVAPYFFKILICKKPQDRYDIWAFKWENKLYSEETELKFDDMKACLGELEFTTGLRVLTSFYGSKVDNLNGTPWDDEYHGCQPPERNLKVFTGRPAHFKFENFL